MGKLKMESIRVFVFLCLVFTIVMLKWWIVPILLIFFPWVLKKVKNERSGKTNIGYLVNYITDCIVQK